MAIGLSVFFGTSRVLFSHYADQDMLLAVFRKLWAKEHFNLDRLDQLHCVVRVGGWHLALLLAEYEALESFAARNAVWTCAVIDLGVQVLRAVLEVADLCLADLDQIVFVT